MVKNMGIKTRAQSALLVIGQAFGLLNLDWLL